MGRGASAQQQAVDYAIDFTYVCIHKPDHWLVD